MPAGAKKELTYSLSSPKDVTWFIEENVHYQIEHVGGIVYVAATATATEQLVLLQGQV